MWTIRRIRLDRVGTPAARFLDVTIDLTSPTTGRPVDTILWLRNGGGKTTIMALVGALLRPARDEFLSSTEGARDGGRHIEDYVLGPDTAHVAVEWGDGNRRLVTGAVYEWTDRQPPADPTRDHDRLNAGFYAFTPVPGQLEIERLPYAVGAHRTTLEAFLSHLKPFTTTDVVVTRKKGDWVKALDDRRIDSDLWRTILAMNRSEGGIEAQFLFSNPADFVKYLLRLITDPEEPDGVADLLRKVAARLVRRPDLLEELRFVREAVERMTELDVGYRDDLDAQSLLTIAEGQARDLRAGLEAGEEAARAMATAAEDERAASALSRREHDRDAEIARHTQMEYRRIAALRRRDAATLQVKAVGGRMTTARAAVDAWTVAPQVAARDAAAERERTLAADFAAATAEAEPERIAYLTEAGRLGRLLADLADAAEALVDVAGGARTNALAGVEIATSDLEAATGRRAVLDARATELARLHRALDEDLVHARADRLLDAGETAAAALERHRADDEAAALAEAAAKADVERLNGEITTATETRATARAELAEAKVALTTATAARDEITTRIAEVAAEARLADLLGTDTIDPLAMAPNLLGALREAVGRAGRELVDLGVAGAEDTRALAALDSDEGLLPPALDLSRALDTLATAKIPATTGWSYLARIAVERRLAVFLAVPTLAGGALVHDAADLPRARLILAEAGFAPTTILGVGSTADLDAAASGGGITGPFVMPANGALYDRDRAREERMHRDEAQRQRTTQRAAVDARQDADRGLIARVEHLVATCPPDRLPTLDDQITRLSSRRDALAGSIERERLAIDAKTLERTAATWAGTAAGNRRHDLARKIARADGLAVREAAATETRAEASGLTERIANEREAETAAKRARDDNQHRADEALRRGLEMSETARGYRGQIADLPAERVVAAKADSRSLDELGAAVSAARERYEARTSGSPLAKQTEHARDERSRLDHELETKPEEVIEHARRLIKTANGGNPIARDRALRAASADAEQAAREDGLAQAALGEAAAELDRYTREDRERHRQLDQEPETRDEALALAEEQRVIAERLNHQVTEDDARINAARERLTESDRRAERLHDIADRIRLPEVEPPPTAAPWTESPDAAAARADELLRDIAEADREVTRTKNALNDLRARILRWSGDFPTVPVEVTSRFRSEGVIDELGPEARIWRDRMTVRADELDIDLRELEEHRTNVITRAIGMVNDALGDLDRFSRLSEMPEELGEAWGGRKFVEVHVRPSVDRSEPVMRDRIGREVDRIVDARAEPRGMDFLWRAVSAVVGDTGFAARVLKPSPSYSTERVPIEAMRKWSGGEKVTAALLLFVTVAKLRARNRGRSAAGAGALMLDNPLGKANYVPFLSLQRAVARSAGVQLVFLTGVADMKAVGLFPRIARLRNSPSKGRDYVSLEGYELGPEDTVGAVAVTHGGRMADPLQLGLE